MYSFFAMGYSFIWLHRDDHGLIFWDFSWDNDGWDLNGYSVSLRISSVVSSNMAARWCPIVS